MSGSPVDDQSGVLTLEVCTLVSSKPSKGKATDFERPGDGGSRTGGRANGTKPLEHQAQGERSQRARRQGKSQACKAAGV